MPDHLADNAADEDKPMIDHFPDEFIANINTEDEHYCWCMYFGRVLMYLEMALVLCVSHLKTRIIRWQYTYNFPA